MKQIQRMFGINCVAVCAFVATLLSMGCQNTGTVETIAAQPAPELGISAREEVLIVGYAYEREIRKSFEDQIVSQLQKEGVRAAASYRVYRELLQINGASLVSYLSQADDRAVLMSRAVSVRRNQSIEMAKSGSLSGMSLFDSNRDDWEINMSYTVATELYRSGSHSSVWSTVQQVELADASSLGILVKEIVSQMQQKRVLESLGGR